MRQDKEEWLKQKIEEDLDALAEERVKLLMELEELQNIHMPAEKLDDIHREIEARNRTRSRLWIRRRAFLAAAAALVLVMGFGAVSSGSKLYVPKVFHREHGNEVSIEVDNTETIEHQYDEEEVRQEIEEELGVIVPRLFYKPAKMVLIDYSLDIKAKEAIIKYGYDKYQMYIYISKDYSDSTIGFQTDNEVVDKVTVESCGLEIPVYEYQDPEKKEYFMASFEYLNTYYFISGMIEKREFQKILENILIKNV